jgi:hypothetical protein
MTHSSISFVGDGTSIVSEIDFASSTTSTNFLYQCLTAFNEWISTLDSFEQRFQGNLVAVPEIDKESGLVHVGKTEVVPQESPTTNDIVYLGVSGTKKHLVHGGVVAFQGFAKYGSVSKNAFLRGKGACTGERSSDRLPKGWDDTLFLVVDLGRCHFAFYNPARHVFLGIDLNGIVFEQNPEVDLSAPGVQDEDFMSCIPPGAIFVVQSEKVDGREVSLYSKRSKLFVGVTSSGAITSSKSVHGDWDLSLEIVVIMESWRLENVAHHDQLPLTRANTIQQCFEVFEAWKKGLDAFPGKCDGNLVATAREITVVGDIGSPQTEVHFRQGVKDSRVRVGKPGTINSLAMGSIVVLHNKGLNQDLEINQGQVGASSPDSHCRRLTYTNGRHQVCNLFLADTKYPLLVIRLGRERIAFYHIHNEEFLVMKRSGTVVGVQARKPLRNCDVSDESFTNQLPEGAIFMMNPECSDHSVVSFYSEKFEGYLTVNKDKSVNGSSDSPGPSQMFHIIVLMSIERFGEQSHKAFDEI